jgi:RNA polymerase sigma-19 factor, ECF subfamily
MLQDVFLKLWNNRENLDTSLSLNSYIYTIAKNLSIDYIRKKKVKIFPIEYLNERNLVEHNNGESDLIAGELNQLFQEAIGCLSPRMKEVFTLHRIEKLTYTEISNQLGISVSAVEKNISSALKSIRKYVAERR